jgi:hypothetical protein
MFNLIFMLDRISISSDLQATYYQPLGPLVYIDYGYVLPANVPSRLHRPQPNLVLAIAEDMRNARRMGGKDSPGMQPIFDALEISGT